MYSEAVSSSLDQESHDGHLLTYKNCLQFVFLEKLQSYKQGGYLTRINWYQGKSVRIATTDTQSVSLSTSGLLRTKRFKLDISYVKQ